MDEKKREELDDVITVVEDYDDFQTLVKERKKNSEGAATAEDGKVKKESSDSDKKAASDKKEDSEKKEVYVLRVLYSGRDLDRIMAAYAEEAGDQTKQVKP